MIENDSALFKVDIENYKGPLDVLLDLAKAQKVNLEDISITKLADPFRNLTRWRPEERFESQISRERRCCY